jgi:hypothetical protein
MVIELPSQTGELPVTTAAEGDEFTATLVVNTPLPQPGKLIVMV